MSVSVAAAAPVVAFEVEMPRVPVVVPMLIVVVVEVLPASTNTFGATA